MRRSGPSILAALALAVGLLGPTQVGVTPASAAPPSRDDPCGTKIAKPTGGHWSCVLAEQFDGSSLNGKYWTALTQPGPAGGACNVNDPRTVRVAGGTLQLTVRPVGDGLVCPQRKDGSRASYASASVSTYWKWSQQYGRFEARFKTHATLLPGLQEAFWLWPDERYSSVATYPASGEIDVVETYSQYPDLAIPFLHYNPDDNGGPVPGLNTAWNCVSTRGEFHTYVLEWTADRLEIFVDGRSCLVNTAGASSFRKRFIVSFTQMLGAGANAYTGLVPLPATMEVDYLKVWR